MVLNPASSTPPPRPRSSRQNFYNYRTDYDDDNNYAQFEGDTAGNFHSEFGLRTHRRQRLPPTQPTAYADEEPESDSWTNEDGVEQQQLESPAIRVKEGGRSHNFQRGDGSYSFGYDLEDQSRHESSDSFGNVNGYYSYIDDDGILRRVSYSAGPSTGFVVHNRQKTRVRPLINRTPPLIIPDSPKYHQTQAQHQGWGEADEGDYQRQPQRPWPPRRRKPSYVVKIRRPVKKEPGKSIV